MIFNSLPLHKKLSQEKVEPIIDQYYDSIYKYCCCHLNFNHDLARDCTQDVFLTFYNAYQKLQDYQYIRAWLYRTADNYIHRYRSKMATINKHELPIEEAEFQETHDIERIVEDSVNVEKYIFRIFTSLSPADIVLYNLYYRDKIGVQGLMDSLNISYNAAVTRVYRLRLKIKTIARKLLDDE